MQKFREFSKSKQKFTLFKAKIHKFAQKRKENSRQKREFSIKKIQGAVFRARNRFWQTRLD